MLMLIKHGGHFNKVIDIWLNSISMIISAYTVTQVTLNIFCADSILLYCVKHFFNQSHVPDVLTFMLVLT